MQGENASAATIPDRPGSFTRHERLSACHIPKSDCGGFLGGLCIESSLEQGISRTNVCRMGGR